MAYIVQSGADPVTGQVTIPNGQSLSDTAFMGGVVLHGIVMPAAFTGTTLSFQVSFDSGASWKDLYSASGEVNPAAAAARFIALDPVLFRSVNALKVRSGTAASPTNEGGARVLTLVCRPAA